MNIILNCINYNDDICNVKTSSVLADLEQKGITKDDIDLIIGGPPCPGFSNIGRSKIVSLLRKKEWNWVGRPPKEWRHQFNQIRGMFENCFTVRKIRRGFSA